MDDQRRLCDGDGGGAANGGSEPIAPKDGDAFGGVVDLIQSGAVGIRVGRIRRFTSQGVVVAEGTSRHSTVRSDGSTAPASPAPVETSGAAATVGSGAARSEDTHLAYDSVILATGFRHRMADFLCAKDGLLTTTANTGTGTAATAVASAVGAAEGLPIIDSRSRSRVVDSIYFVGMNQFKSTLSIGPVLGYRGYDVGAAIASDLYGPPSKPLRFPSLPADEQDGSKPLVTPARALGVFGAGMLVGIGGSLLMSAMRPRPGAGHIPRTLAYRSRSYVAKKH